jgi:hypothetical protein
MILRVLNFVVIGALILAAAYVYRIKYDSTVQAERLAKIRGEIRRERDAIAALREKWAELDSPARVEALAKRYLQLKPIAPTQFDTLDHLPERPPELVPQGSKDPIGAMIETTEEPGTTGSIASPSELDAVPPSLLSPPQAVLPAAPAVPADEGAESTAPVTELPAQKSGRIDR